MHYRRGTSPTSSVGGLLKTRLEVLCSPVVLLLPKLCGNGMLAALKLCGGLCLSAGPGSD